MCWAVSHALSVNSLKPAKSLELRTTAGVLSTHRRGKGNAPCRAPAAGSGTV